MSATVQGSESPAVWAVIPARGGSKGVPRKNLTEVRGRSLIERAISACLASASVTLTVVSTDDDEIASVAAAAGAAVAHRPDALSNDEATSESVIAHVLSLLRPEHGEPSLTLMVQCTSPFVSAGDIDRVVEVLTEFDSVFTASEYHGFLWQMSEAGIPVAVNHDPTFRLRRQDIQPQYRENGSIYGFRTTGFLDAGRRFFGRVGFVITDSNLAIEIDDPVDLLLAEALADRFEGEY